jgi:hypothetical protein
MSLAAIPAYGESSSVAPLFIPAPVQSLVYFFERSHEIWRGWRKTDLATRNVYYFLAYGGSSGADYFLGFIPGYSQIRQGLLSPPARWVKQAACILSAVDSIKTLAEQSLELHRIWESEILKTPQRIHLRNKYVERFFCASNIHFVQSRINKALERIRVVFLAAIEVLRNSWIVSMRIMDIKEAFSQRDDDQDANIREALTNGMEFFRLLGDLQKDEPIVQWVMFHFLSDMVHSPAILTFRSIEYALKFRAFVQRCLLQMQRLLERIKNACKKVFNVEESL